MNCEKKEFPCPQFEREAWINLNGEWQFEIDNAMVGEAKEFFKCDNFERKINVPFCPESKLSGIGETDFMNCVWYRKDFEIPENFKGKDVILHFGAVDYRAVVYINGKKVGTHCGGYTSFSFNITEYLEDANNYITLCAYDDARSANQPAGKQSSAFHSAGCFYTRITGIWQTVWLEFTNKCHIDNFKITTNIETPSANIEIKMSEYKKNAVVSAEVFYDGKAVGKASTTLWAQTANLNIVLSEKHLWEVGAGRLYDVIFTVTADGETIDEVKSYFGLRSVTLDDRSFKINGKTVFGRWVLDQGYYPDGLYTAPNEDALKADIINSIALGFNGARLHEKVFEPRFLYWADKFGYMVWGEHANWGLDITEPGQIMHFLPEWTEAVSRDFNHPSIIGWCPFNETWDFEGRKQCDAIVENVYKITKLLDPTRPVIDTSGNFHTITDIFDVHNYEQDPEKFAQQYEKLTDGEVYDTIARNPNHAYRQKYDGKMPIFVSEYGGASWAVRTDDGWGYGNGPKTEEEFIERYKGLTETLLNNPYMLGFCYTQLYDIEQEQNGLMTYDRKFKFDPEIFKKINTQKAAIEKLDE